jgi:PAS domain S-box-containing protein
MAEDSRLPGTERELEAVADALSRLRKLEASLHERERELQQARRIARLGTWRWVAATDTAVWSDEVYDILGRDPELPPLSYSELQSLHTPESRARRDAAVSKVMRDGELYEHEMELLLPDGSCRWIVMRGEAAARDAEGRVTELRGTMQDITQRKLTELALRDRERELQEAHTISRLGTWRFDVERQEVQWSPEVYAIFGLNPEIGSPTGALLEPMFLGDGWTASRAAIDHATATGERYEFDAEIRAADGVHRWFTTRGGPAKWSSRGEVLELRGTVQDITERKQIEEALREREQRFRELAESLPEMVWVSEPDGFVSYINQRFERYIGVPLAQLTGGTAFDHVHPDDRGRSEMLWQRSITTGESYEMEVRLQRHDGVYRTFLARAVPISNDRGEIERWLGTATDVHDQMLAEEAVRRTEKLAATGRLAASIAHEINNPLTAVTNLMYLTMLDQTLSEETRGYLEQAQQELARVAAVTTQTLRFHQQSTAPAEIEVGEIMDSAFGLFEGRFKSRGIAVRREYTCKEKLFCRGDELRQVFANLLSNSLDAMQDGGSLRIRIRLSRTPAGECGVRVTVGDSGHGIPKEFRRRVFEPFLSTKAATGTGLGLWVSHGIVHRHKGTIQMRSRTQNGSGATTGTVFRLFFPLNGMR